jgi:hypothetical protein
MNKKVNNQRDKKKQASYGVLRSFFCFLGIHKLSVYIDLKILKQSELKYNNCDKCNWIKYMRNPIGKNILDIPYKPK